MRVYKPSYKTKDGKKARKYYVEVQDHRGINRKFVGLSDKRLTAAMGAQIKLLIECKRAGQPPDAMLCQWLRDQPDELRKRLAMLGIIDNERAAAGRKLTEHLSDYRQYIGDNTKHAKATHNVLLAVFKGCKFEYWNDIRASQLHNYLIRLKTKGEISQRTFNAYLKAAKSFCSWMVQNRNANESPISHLKPIQITKREVNRRVLENDELQKFLNTTAKGSERYGMGGQERYLLYRFAVETGLRANEIRNLRKVDFDFQNLTVTIGANSSKRKKLDVQRLKPDTAELLKEFFKNKTFIAKAFGGTYKQLTDRTAEMVQDDLKEANIKYEDAAGRVFDFHSLRHQTGTMLARAGVHPKDAQIHMRHSSIEITMKYYTHLSKGAEIETAAKIPDLSLSKEDDAEKLSA